MIKNIKIWFTLLLSLCVLSSIVIFHIELLQDFQKSKDAFSCGRFVREENIFTDNVIWQVFETPQGFFYILNAYLDGRWNQTIVRINVLGPLITIGSNKLFCQFWFDEHLEPVAVEASEYQTLWFNSKFNLF